MYQIIHVYSTIHSYQTHGLLEVHSVILEGQHTGTLKSAKNLAIQRNNWVQENPDCLGSDSFYYIRSKKTKKPIDVGAGIGDQGVGLQQWSDSQKTGYQPDMFQQLRAQQ